MKRLLIPLLTALVLPTAVNANVDPKVAEMCMKAVDFKGCVESMSGGVKKNDSTEGLKNVMKQVAARLENGVSLKTSTDAFRPLVDQLAIVKDSYPDDGLVVQALKAQSLFGILQTYWYNSIYYKGIAMGLNPEIEKFNVAAEKEVITPLTEKKRYGVIQVDETDAQVARAMMYQYVILVLKDDPSLKEIPKSIKIEPVKTISKQTNIKKIVPGQKKSGYEESLIVNSCPEGNAYVGNGLCRKVECVYPMNTFKAAKGHDQIVAGKSDWSCKDKFIRGVGLLTLGSEFTKATVNDICPNSEPEIGWKSSCEKKISKPTLITKKKEYPTTENKKKSDQTLSIKNENPSLPTTVNANSHVYDSLNTADENSHVYDSLNAADVNFNVGNKDMACTMVSMAILAANSPEIYGATSSSLKREVKNYANRCDLRF